MRWARSRGLQSRLQHDAVSRLEDAISRIDRYSTASAEMLVASGRRVSFASGITHGLWTFFRVYVLRLGFLDGKRRLSAGGRQRRRQLLSLHEGVARGALQVTDLISVIVATYNRPDALAACLRSLTAQTDRNFEIVVADDGSDTTTGSVDHRLVAAHESCRSNTRGIADNGFRLAEIRNRAIRISAGDYCVFLDGDCIARPGFVAAHRALMEPGWFVTGNRMLLSRDLTERVLEARP